MWAERAAEWWGDFEGTVKFVWALVLMLSSSRSLDESYQQKHPETNVTTMMGMMMQSRILKLDFFHLHYAFSAGTFLETIHTIYATSNIKLDGISKLFFNYISIY